jgi:hypothetical protein
MNGSQLVPPNFSVGLHPSVPSSYPHVEPVSSGVVTAMVVVVVVIVVVVVVVVVVNCRSLRLAVGCSRQGQTGTR